MTAIEKMLTRMPRTKHTLECLVVIRAAFLNACSHLDRGAPIFIENIHALPTGTAAYFTDPHDGQRYRISIETAVDEPDYPCAHGSVNSDTEGRENG